MMDNLHIYKTPEELADVFANQFMKQLESHSGENFHLAISGGKTPDLLFSILADNYADSILWKKIHFWWVDERMVVPDHPESNYGVAQKLLFSRISIPVENIHRIKGENIPEDEALSYSEQLKNNLEQLTEWPEFDLILLGMGDDGHTASIFPNHMELLASHHLCEVAKHPQSGQKRVTLTGNVINNANRICFLVTGSNKSKRISEILTSHETSNLLPAKYIRPTHGVIEWHIDKAAATDLES